MNLPQIGELNRRVKIFFTVHLPDDRLGLLEGDSSRG